MEKLKEVKLFEQWEKFDNKYVFIGWHILPDESYCIKTRKHGKYIYKTYCFNGKIEQLKIGACVGV